MPDSPFRSSQDTSDFNTFMVPKKLDDSRLSPAEFRVYCHLARRQDKDTRNCHPGIRSIAEICQLSKDTVVAAISTLESLHMVTAKRTQGEVTIYHLEPMRLWKVTVLNEGTVCPNPRNGVSEIKEHHCPKRRNERLPTEGYPLEVNPSKGGCDEEVGFRLEVLREAICQMFDRGRDERWPDDDEHYLFDVARRKTSLDEMESIRGFYESKDRAAVATTPRGLLMKWLETYERSKHPENERKNNGAAPSRNEGTYNTGKGYGELVRKQQAARMARNANLRGSSPGGTPG